MTQPTISADELQYLIDVTQHRPKYHSAFKELQTLRAQPQGVLPQEPTDAVRSAIMGVLLNSSNIYTREGEETIVVETYAARAIYAAILAALTAGRAAVAQDGK